MAVQSSTFALVSPAPTQEGFVSADHAASVHRYDEVWAER